MHGFVKLVCIQTEKCHPDHYLSSLLQIEQYTDDLRRNCSYTNDNRRVQPSIP
jgi:hypothetical protein